MDTKQRLRAIYAALKPLDGIKYAAARYHIIDAGKRGVGKALSVVRWAQTSRADERFILAAQGFADEGDPHQELSTEDLAEYFSGLELAENLIMSVDFDLAEHTGGSHCVCVECMLNEKGATNHE